MVTLNIVLDVANRPIFQGRSPLCHLRPQVYNVNEMYGPESERPVDITIDMAKVMGVFLAQLRLVLDHLTLQIEVKMPSLPGEGIALHFLYHFLCLFRLMLGLQHTRPPTGFVLQSPGSAGLADWELDRLLWSRSVENIATASTTITSLAQLLDQIGNIVINDNIAEQVRSPDVHSSSHNEINPLYRLS